MRQDPKTTLDTRAKRFTEVERKKGRHPAMAALDKARSAPQGDGRRVAEFARVERGREA